MKRMSFSETVFLFFLALIIFGPKKLPEIARQVGKMLNEFRRASNEFKSQIEQEIAHLEVENHKRTILPPTLPPEGTASRSLNAAAPEPAATETPTAPPVFDDEPLFATTTASSPASSPFSDSGANGSAAAHPAPTEAVPTAESVESSTSQESHV